MSRIKIINTCCALDEHQLNDYESQGLELISVNHIVTNEYRTGMGPDAGKHDVIRWTYHFRSNNGEN